MARKTFLKCFRCNARCLLLLLACISSVLLLHSCKDGEDLHVTTFGLKLLRDLAGVVARGGQSVEHFGKRISLIESHT